MPLLALLIPMAVVGLMELLSYIEEKHHSAMANVWLATIYYARGNKEKALSYLDRIKDTSFAAVNKYETLGDIMAQEGQLDKAVDAYKRALAINSGYL